MPNHIVQLKVQLMGAAFSAVGWMIVSWIFSVYLDIFKGFSSMYGSLTTIVLIMLWLYFCMYILLLGGGSEFDPAGYGAGVEFLT